MGRTGLLISASVPLALTVTPVVVAGQAGAPPSGVRFCDVTETLVFTDATERTRFVDRTERVAYTADVS